MMTEQVKNKTIIYTLLNIAYLLVVSLVALGSSKIFEGYTGLIVGLGLMVVCIPFAAIYSGKRIVSAVIIGLNAVFTGVAVSVCYTVGEFGITILDCVQGVALGFATYIGFHLLNSIPFMVNHRKTKYFINSVLVIALILVYAFAFEILEKDMFVMAAILSAISLAFVFVMRRHDYTIEQLFKSLLICSYSVFVVAVIVTVIIISDGEAGDGLDIEVGNHPTKADAEVADVVLAGLDIPAVEDNQPPVQEVAGENPEEKNKKKGNDNG